LTVKYFSMLMLVFVLGRGWGDPGLETEGALSPSIIDSISSSVKSGLECIMWYSPTWLVGKRGYAEGAPPVDEGEP